MSDTPGHKPPVKIYDRPETKTVSPMILVIAMIVLLLAGFLTYRFVSQARRAPQSQTRVNPLFAPSAFATTLRASGSGIG